VSFLVVGLSHHRAPIALLEQVSLDSAAAAALTERLLAREHVSEALVLSTCNRTEVYAEADTFHGALADISAVIGELTGIPAEELAEHAHVHYGERAVAHTFAVAAGLDSMAVGETQVLGQLRSAFAAAQGSGAAGTALHSLIQRALRVGKDVHHRTGLDQVTVSLVDAGIEVARAVLGGLSGVRVAIVGAGSMAGLSAAHVLREEPAAITVLSRTHASAARLAERVGGTSRPLTDLADVLADSDLVITSTGATGHVIDAELLRSARANADRPVVLVDLAVPRDVDPDVDGLPGVTRVDLEGLRAALESTRDLPQVREASDLVVASVAAYVAERGAERVAPTVAALRERAAEVVAAELGRFDRRVDLDEHARAEVERLVGRVVDKLLHTPTVRVKELSSGDDGLVYAEALRELFQLDPHETAAVSTPPRDLGAIG
jgi:glutamyl-tRNA reductase